MQINWLRTWSLPECDSNSWTIHHTEQLCWLTDRTQFNLDQPEQPLFNELWTTATGEQGSIFDLHPSRVALEDELSVVLPTK